MDRETGTSFSDECTQALTQSGIELQGFQHETSMPIKARGNECRDGEALSHWHEINNLKNICKIL